MKEAVVKFREFWGVDKRAALIESLDAHDFDAGYEVLNPKASNKFLLRSGTALADYEGWPALSDLVH